MMMSERSAPMRGVLLVCLAAAGASGAGYHWDPDGAASATVGGTGTWDTTSSQWRLSTSTGDLGAWVNTGTDTDATFGNSAGTVTLSSGLNVNDMTFAVGGMTLKGEALNLVGTTSVLDIGSGTTTFEMALSGSGTLTKQNSGVLVFKNNASTFSGVVRVMGGQLQVSALANGGVASAIGMSSSAASNLVIGGGTLILRADATGPVTTDRLFSMHGGAIISNLSNQVMTFSNTGDIAHIAAGSRAITFQANFTVDNLFRARLTNNGANNLSVNKSGGGRWILDNAGNSFAGAIGISQGRLGLANAGAAGLGTSILLANSNTSAYLEAHAGLALGSAKTITLGSTNVDYQGYTAFLVNQSAAASVFDVQSRIVSAVTSSGNSDAKLGLAAPLAAASVIRLSNLTNSFTGQVVASGGVVEFASVADAGVASALGAGVLAHSLANASEMTWRHVGASAGSTNRSLDWSGAGNLRLESTGEGAVSWLGTGSLRSGATGGQLTLAGTNTGLNTLGQVIDDGTGAAVSVRKEGAGRWVLSGANTYTGGTTVAAGTLALAEGGALGTGGLSVLKSGRLGGTGTVGVATSIVGTHAPGNSPGLQGFSAGISYATGSVFEWEFAGDALALRGTDYDGVDVSGGVLDISAGAILKVINLDAIDYKSAEWSDFRTFTVFSLSGAATKSGMFTLNQTLAGQRGPGYWFLSEDGSAIQLNWSPVPEPSTYGLILGGLALAVAAARRRRK